jgi:hypothetical protein
VKDLPLQVGELDDVGIREPESADAGQRQVERSRRTEPADADDQNAARLQPSLALEPDVRKTQVPRVTAQLLRAELGGTRWLHGVAI